MTSYMWFYDLAIQIKEWVDEVNAKLGYDIYYTERDAVKRYVTIRDERDASVFYVWFLDPLWCAGAWKEAFHKRFDRIIDLLKAKYREVENSRRNTNMDNMWFYHLAADVDRMVDKLNEGLGQNIYYTAWSTKDCVIEITDSRDDQVSYVWKLEYYLTKEAIREKFGRIINDLRCFYTIREGLRKAKEERDMDYSKRAETKMVYTAMDYSTIKATGIVDCSSITTGYVDLDWSVASIAAKGLYSHWATPVWKKVKGQIDRVIFNDPATIILWKSGERTVVKCGLNEDFDKEKGLAMALCKYILGNKGNFNEFFKSFIEED